MKTTKKIITFVCASAPLSALAATDIGTLDFKGLVSYFITDFIQPAITLIFALAILYFLWNIAEIIRASKQGEELANLKTKTLWGVIAIFVMVSIWGLVSILVNTFVPASTLPLSGGSTSSWTTSGGTTSGGVDNIN